MNMLQKASFKQKPICKELSCFITAKKFLSPCNLFRLPSLSKVSVIFFILVICDKEESDFPLVE